MSIHAHFVIWRYSLLRLYKFCHLNKINDIFVDVTFFLFIIRCILDVMDGLQQFLYTN